MSSEMMTELSAHLESNPVQWLPMGVSQALAANGTAPLVDTFGNPLLPRIVRQLRRQMAETSAPAGRQFPPRERSVPDLGEAYPAVDHALLAAYVDRGRLLQAQAMTRFLVALARKAGKLTRWVRGALSRVLSPGPAGKAELPTDYWRNRALFFGSGL